MTFVVDASVAIKWLLPEPHADAALRLLREGHELEAPDLLLPEVGNALWKRVRRQQATVSEMVAALEALVSLPLEFHSSGPLMVPAFEIACATGRTVYDSVYLAVAVLRECPLVTADRKFHAALEKTPFAPSIVWVADVPVTS